MPDGHRAWAARRWRAAISVIAVMSVVHPRTGVAQGLTGTLAGIVRDDQGGVLPGVDIRIQSAALIGGPARQTTNETGRFRFQHLIKGRPTVMPSHLYEQATEQGNVRPGSRLETFIGLVSGFADVVVPLSNVARTFDQDGRCVDCR